MNKDQAKQIVHNLLSKAQSRFKQEIKGEHENLIDGLIREFHAKVARHSWKSSQKWSKWNNEGPVLMPDYTRIYYRKGVTEILLQEFPPQIRLMKFKGQLAKRASSDEPIDKETCDKTFHYSLALPYMVFIFKYVNGLFDRVQCMFCDRPLKRLEEQPLIPYLSNIDSSLMVCLGHSLERDLLEKDNITQQSALILSNFWHTAYNDEWSGHFWNSKTHFQNCDPRLATLEDWQKHSEENPLFVIEDVKWLQYKEGNFGDIIVRMFENDQTNQGLRQELYDDLAKELLPNLIQSLETSIDGAGERANNVLIDQLADELLKSI